MLEVANNKRKMIISGVAEIEGENTIEIAEQFFKVKLQIKKEIKITHARRLQRGNPKSIEVTLENFEDKTTIFKHLKNLKGVKNEKGFAYQVRTHIPERLQEEDMRRRQMIRENRNRSTAHRLQMSIKRNQLYMNNAPYKKKVQVPTEKELLEMDDEERENIQTAKLASTASYKEKHNTFIAYGMETAEISTVRAVYKHLKLKHHNATHITVAYNIVGENPEYADYEDNGEIIAGSCILKAMKDARRVNAAIYLVRYHSGQNLGSRQFEVFKEMAACALQLFEDKENFVTSRVPMHKYAVKLQRKSSRQQTRGRIVGARGGGHTHRGRGGIQHIDDVSSAAFNSEKETDTDMDTEVTINHTRVAKNSWKIYL